MHYVDGFVIPMPKKNVPSYMRMAKKAARIFKEYGALEDCECAADDLRTPMGGAPFTKIAKAKKNEAPTAWRSSLAESMRWMCLPPPSEYLWAHHWTRK